MQTTITARHTEITEKNHTWWALKPGREASHRTGRTKLSRREAEAISEGRV